MNALTRRDPAEFLPAKAMPELHPKVAAGLRLHQTRRYPDQTGGEEAGYLAPLPDALDEEGRAQARHALEVMGHALTPVTLVQFAAWLATINAMVSNPLPEDLLKMKARALHGAFAEEPAGAFTLETARAAGRRLKFFPAAAEVEEIVRPIANGLMRDEGYLRDLATRVPEPPRRAGAAARKPEEIAHVQQATAALRAEAKATEEAMRPRKLTLQPRPLSPQQLMATYEAQIAAGQDQAGLAALRLDALRRQFGEGASA